MPQSTQGNETQALPGPVQRADHPLGVKTFRYGAALCIIAFAMIAAAGDGYQIPPSFELPSSISPDGMGHTFTRDEARHRYYSNDALFTYPDPKDFQLFCSTHPEGWTPAAITESGLLWHFTSGNPIDRHVHVTNQDYAMVRFNIDGPETLRMTPEPPIPQDDITLHLENGNFLNSKPLSILAGIATGLIVGCCALSIRGVNPFDHESEA